MAESIAICAILKAVAWPGEPQLAEFIKEFVLIHGAVALPHGGRALASSLAAPSSSRPVSRRWRALASFDVSGPFTGKKGKRFAMCEAGWSTATEGWVWGCAESRPGGRAKAYFFPKFFLTFGKL